MSGWPERTDQQRAASGERDRDVFLRAGAGTGKTTVLVDRFCMAALDPEVGIDGVLAFTFTERAADQLRSRIRAELSALAADASGERLELLREAERAADRAWISTIHGFCRRLLASHPATAGIDPRFRVVDEAEADRLAARAFEAALDELIESGGGEALELAAANRRGQLLEMTRGAYDELRSHGKSEPALPPVEPVDPAAAIGALVEAAREAHPECAEAKGAKQVEARERIAAAAELDPRIEPDAETLETLASLRLESKAAAFRGNACERYSTALALARSAVAGHVMAPAYEQLRELVRLFGRRYEGLKDERSALDFEDLQLRAVGLLRSSDAVRDRYREQFRHLMVDEFQDTNSLQLALIEQLHGPRTRLFMVGDEFQSIYGFRHADVEVYRREHRRFAEDENPGRVALPLTGNFRAAPEIVAATNSIGSSLLDRFEPLTAAADAPGAGGDPIVELQLTLDDPKRWEAPETGLPMLSDDPSSASKVAEARLLAARLRELVDDGEDPAEIVVLLRALTHVATIDRALGDAGLDPYVVGGRGFWSQQQIEDLRCLLAVVANPLEDQALFGALASPACGVLPDTLWLLRKSASVPGEGGRRWNRHVWPLVRDLVERGEPSEGDAEAAALIPGDELERLKRFADRLDALRSRGAEGGLETLVDGVATTFGYDLATLMREDGPARWANVRKLMRLAREFEAREGPDLGGFLDYLNTRAGRRDREAEAASRAEGHAGVRVMSVHAAKGLEFGVVAVADLGRKLQLGWTPLRVAVGEDPPDGGEAARVGVQLGRLGRPAERLHDYEDLTERAATREAEEEARLAYVAATRAKRRLLLSGTCNPRSLENEPAGRQPITVQLVRSILGGEMAECDLEIPAAEAGGFPVGRLRVRVSAPEPGSGAALLTPREPDAAAAPAPDAEPPLLRPAAPPALTGGLSYSALSEFGECGYRFYVERVLGISGPAQDATTAREDPERDPGFAAEVQASGTSERFGLGLAVHTLLEWTARRRWRDPDLERAAGALAEQGLDADQAPRVLELAGAWLSSPLRQEIGGDRCRAEVPFVLSVAGTLLRGSIDLLVERADGSVLVVDYKTNRLDGGDPEAAARRYEAQRDLYALAAAARGTPVETAYVFLEAPDRPVRRGFSEADLEKARSRVGERLEDLAAGRFEVTSHPHKALCLDCPARSRLCSHGPESTLRDDPEPPVEPEAPEPGPDERAEGAAEAATQLSLLEGR